ncbi:MAG: HNH endonuclease signature motif containing protein [Burkholderiales bacterium]|nr:HNH endonuclease signature motif containing protein [Burkholderiales bacterium]
MFESYLNSIGLSFTNNELSTKFEVGNSGGMRRSIKNNTLILIADHKKKMYSNIWFDDVLFYTGMGKNGNQSLDYKQNKILKNAKSLGVTLLLFEVYEKNEYIFRGEVELSGEPIKDIQEDINKNEREVFLFPLVLIKNATDVHNIDALRKKKLYSKYSNQSLYLLFKKQKNIRERYITVNTYYRNVVLSEFVKRIANGVCQLCNQFAPFYINSVPYLESHHVIWLSRSGSDSIDNLVAICPNCHKKMHYVEDSCDLDKLLNVAIENKYSFLKMVEGFS